jgi:putative methyltransferase
MNFVYVNYTIRDNVYDYAWLSFKTYVEDNYKGSAKWNWHFPINSSKADNIQELVDEILAKDPTIVGFSVYVWNVGLSREVARLLKEQRPDVYIVFGGPYCEYKEDPDYFKKNPYVDFTCQTDGYGEPFINELLYQIETSQDWMTVPFIVMPDGDGYKSSTVVFNKRSFMWPKRMFARNKDYIEDLINNRAEGVTLQTIYETHRGCPYGCTFCEWSGGINSKVAFRPTENIIEDLTWLAENGALEDLHMVEANLGQLDRDVEIMEYICELKKKYGVPKEIIFAGLSKSKKSNVYKIDRLMAQHGLSSGFKISMQDMDPQVLKNIDRIDEPWEKQFKAYDALRSEFGIKIRAELIRGLPGTTLQNYYYAAGEMAKLNVFWEKYTWHLLPTSPASHVDYINRFKIEMIESLTESTKDAVIREDVLMNGSLIKQRGLIEAPEFVQPSKIVVATMSYTRKDYVEMLVSDSIIFTMETEGYLRRITQYLDSIGIPHSLFYQRFYQTFLTTKYLDSISFSVLNSIILQAQQKVQEKSAVNFEYYRLDGLPWKVYAKMPAIINIVINLNRDKFYHAVKTWIIDEFGEDDRLDDLIEWSINSVKWIDYNPDQPRSFITQYDWTRPDSPVGRYMNTPRDTTYSDLNHEIDWHTLNMSDRVNKYFIKLCSISGSNKTFEHIEVNPC